MKALHALVNQAPYVDPHEADTIVPRGGVNAAYMPGLPTSEESAADAARDLAAARRHYGHLATASSVHYSSVANRHSQTPAATPVESATRDREVFELPTDEEDGLPRQSRYQAFGPEVSRQPAYMQNTSMHSTVVPDTRGKHRARRTLSAS